MILKRVLKMLLKITSHAYHIRTESGEIVHILSMTPISTEAE